MRELNKTIKENYLEIKSPILSRGCPVCVSAEQMIANSLDPEKVELEIVHLGEAKERIAEAKNQGVKSAPALVLNNTVAHINFGAAQRSRIMRLKGCVSPGRSLFD